MVAMKQLRLWHLLLALLAAAAYFSDELKPLHMWLGYAVAGLIAIRLLMALFGARALGLQRFYPHFTDSQRSARWPPIPAIQPHAAPRHSPSASSAPPPPAS